MSDKHPTDNDHNETGSGPRQEADETTSSDAGLTGDEGTQPVEPGIAHDEDDEDDN